MLAMGNTAGVWCFSAPPPFLQLVQASCKLKGLLQKAALPAPSEHLGVIWRYCSALLPQKLWLGQKAGGLGFTCSLHGSGRLSSGDFLIL